MRKVSGRGEFWFSTTSPYPLPSFAFLTGLGDGVDSQTCRVMNEKGKGPEFEKLRK